MAGARWRSRFLFLFAGSEGRLPCRALLAWRGGNDLGLLFLGLLRFPIASLLAFGHVDLLGCDGDTGIECRIDQRRNYQISCSQRRGVPRSYLGLSVMSRSSYAVLKGLEVIAGLHRLLP